MCRGPLLIGTVCLLVAMFLQGPSRLPLVFRVLLCASSSDATQEQDPGPFHLLSKEKFLSSLSRTQPVTSLDDKNFSGNYWYYLVYLISLIWMRCCFFSKVSLWFTKYLIGISNLIDLEIHRAFYGQSFREQHNNTIQHNVDGNNHHIRSKL